MSNKEKTQKQTRTYIGGQAVLEGVMMRGKTAYATAVRDPEGNIQVESRRLNTSKHMRRVAKIPLVRGIVNLVSSLVSGSRILMRSAEVYGDEGEPGKFEKWCEKKLHINLMSAVTVFATVLGVLLAVEELLGIQVDQFRQIAMIAQGDFLRVLLASTEERKKIFRQLFGTERFGLETGRAVQHVVIVECCHGCGVFGFRGADCHAAECCPGRDQSKNPSSSSVYCDCCISSSQSYSVTRSGRRNRSCLEMPSAGFL